jgi:hypothetical protein
MAPAGRFAPVTALRVQLRALVIELRPTTGISGYGKKRATTFDKSVSADPAITIFPLLSNLAFPPH